MMSERKTGVSFKTPIEAHPVIDHQDFSSEATDLSENKFWARAETKLMLASPTARLQAVKEAKECQDLYQAWFRRVWKLWAQIGPDF